MLKLDLDIERPDRAQRGAMDVLFKRKSVRARGIGILAMGACLLGCGWYASGSMAVRALFPDYVTGAGELRAVRLADGSTLNLDTKTSIGLSRLGGKRGVFLFDGRLLAHVAKDASHPFVVKTRDGTATALGTAFTVERRDDATLIVVLESRVRACAEGSGSDACVDLVPGDRASLRGGKVVRLGHVEPEAAGLWAEGWLAVDDRPVSEVLVELNRYRDVPVAFDRVSMSGVRVSGSFPLTDPDRALDGILRSTGLRAKQSGGHIEVLR